MRQYFRLCRHLHGRYLTRKRKAWFDPLLYPLLHVYFAPSILRFQRRRNIIPEFDDLIKLWGGENFIKLKQ